MRDEVPRERSHAAIGLIAALLGVGGGLGIAIAGPIVNLLNYHWLFWLPMIVLLLSAVAAHFVHPEVDGTRTPAGSTGRRPLLLSAWLVALLLGVSEAPTWGWVSTKVLGLIVAVDRPAASPGSSSRPRRATR